MVAYTLEVQIAKSDLQMMVDNKYNLCLSKAVSYNGDTTVVPNSVLAAVTFDELAAKLKFAWFEDYQIFMLEKFQQGALVEADTDESAITSAQKASFDKYGTVTLSTDHAVAPGFASNNEWKQGTCVAVNVKAQAGSGPEGYSCTFVSQKLALHSITTLLPIEKVYVFWDSSLNTNTMYEETQTPPWEIDMTSETDQTVYYKDGEWGLGPLPSGK